MVMDPAIIQLPPRFSLTISYHRRYNNRFSCTCWCTTTVVAPTASDVTIINGRTSNVDVANAGSQTLSPTVNGRTSAPISATPTSAAPTPTPTVPASIGVIGSPSQSVDVQPGIPLEAY